MLCSHGGPNVIRCGQTGMDSPEQADVFKGTGKLWVGVRDPALKYKESG